MRLRRERDIPTEIIVREVEEVESVVLKKSDRLKEDMRNENETLKGLIALREELEREQQGKLDALDRVSYPALANGCDSAAAKEMEALLAELDRLPSRLRSRRSAEDQSRAKIELLNEELAAAGQAEALDMAEIGVNEALLIAERIESSLSALVADVDKIRDAERRVMNDLFAANLEPARCRMLQDTLGRIEARLQQYFPKSLINTGKFYKENCLVGILTGRAKRSLVASPRHWSRSTTI